MNVGTAHCEPNPNSSWLSSRGGWISYAIGVIILHLVVRSLPLVYGDLVWTLTNLLHNAIMYVMLHALKGAPWANVDQGRSRRLTHWEQIDAGQQFTRTKKFLTVMPIILFMVVSHCTNYERRHFLVNLTAMALVILPKLPQFHKVRIFDINKY